MSELFKLKYERPRWSASAFTAYCLLPTAYCFALACLMVVSAGQSMAQVRVEGAVRPDVGRALKARTRETVSGGRVGGYSPAQPKAQLPRREAGEKASGSAETRERERRPPARPFRSMRGASAGSESGAAAEGVTTYPRILAGTPLSWVLHTSQLSLTSSAGSNEQYVDASADYVADERTTFDAAGGSFDTAVGRSGARYYVYSATLNNRPVGVLAVALDTNGDFVRDSVATYDLERDFDLPSAVAVVSGRSAAGREFVIVSSSGYYDFDHPSDPDNEPSAGVVLLVRDASNTGFDNSLSRSLVRVGSNQLNNANALALLPNNNLLIADFDSNELRIVRDTNGDRVPDTLDPVPYYRYHYSTDAPLEVAANSRGVVFSHSVGNDTVLLAIYDDNGDGYADVDEVAVRGLSIDNNLDFHGLTVDREGTVYVIEDASGAADLVSEGGNLGWPQVDAFPDPALNGFLRDGALFSEADNGNTQALSGLSFGVETLLPPVARLTMTNGASLTGNGTKSGIAAILGTGLTRGASGRSPADAAARGVVVTIEGRTVPVLTFNDSQINVYVPEAAGTGVGSVVVYVGGSVIAADDVTVVNANPGLFTVPQTGAGEAVALLGGLQLMRGPFNASTAGQPTVVALFGTGWRNSLPVTVRVGGQTAKVDYAGPAGGFNGLDQINVQLPVGVNGNAPVVVTTAGGAVSRADVFVSVK